MEEGTEGEKGPVLVSNSAASGQSHLVLTGCCLLPRASTVGSTVVQHSEPPRGTGEVC